MTVINEKVIRFTNGGRLRVVYDGKTVEKLKGLLMTIYVEDAGVPLITQEKIT